MRQHEPFEEVEGERRHLLHREARVELVPRVELEEERVQPLQLGARAAQLEDTPAKVDARLVEEVIAAACRRNRLRRSGISKTTGVLS